MTADPDGCNQASFARDMISEIEWIGPVGTMGGNALVILPTVVGLMSVVGVLVAFGPARRGLALQPTEALRDE